MYLEEQVRRDIKDLGINVNFKIGFLGEGSFDIYIKGENSIVDIVRFSWYLIEFLNSLYKGKFDLDVIDNEEGLKFCFKIDVEEEDVDLRYIG